MARTLGASPVRTTRTPFAFLAAMALAGACVGASSSSVSPLPGLSSSSSSAQTPSPPGATSRASAETPAANPVRTAATTASPARPSDSTAPVAAWTRTGSLITSRSDHLAIRLADGRMLVAGGSTDWPMGPEGILASAELYDPASGAWSRTGDMVGRRNTGSVFLLNDGRVLVVGASTPGPIFTDAEIYVPDSGTWRSISTVRHVPWQAMAVRLADGRLLIAGGASSDASSGSLASAQLYDPATDTWSATASMPRACSDCRGLLLNDGRVFVTGGSTEDGYTIGLLYSPLAARWSLTTPPSQRGPIRALVLLRNGHVLALHEEPASAELYDPVAGSWSMTTSRKSAGDLSSVTSLADGRVLITVADIYSDSEPPNWAEIYDPARGSWSSAGTTIAHRLFHSATLLADGRVLVAGGSTSGGATTSAEIFDPAALP